MKHKTCHSVVVFVNNQPKLIFQTAWYKHTRTFSMDEKQLAMYASGYCNAKSEETNDNWEFDNCNPDHYRFLTTKEI